MERALSETVSRAALMTADISLMSISSKAASRTGIPVLDAALDDIDIRDISAVISAALETVSDRARSIWKMKREEGKTNPQIAEELNISEKTVEADVTRIRKLINLTIKRNFIFILFL